MATYYISTRGNDGNDGLSSLTPWQTIGSTFQRILRSVVPYQQIKEKTRKREKNEGNRYLSVFLVITQYHLVLHGQISKLLARIIT